MKLERILFEKQNEADETARRKRNKAAYICHLIEMNYEDINKSLGPGINKELETAKHFISPMTCEEYYETRLYENIENIMGELNSSVKSKKNISYPVETESIDVVLGYSKYIKDEGDPFYKKELTEEGKIEVNKYREIIGEPSIGVCIEVNEVLKEFQKRARNSK